MAMFRLVEEGDDLKDAINNILKRDAGTADFGTRIVWTDYTGDVLNRQTGVVTGTSEPTLTIENGAGEHLLIRKSTDSSTILEVQDSGVTISELTLLGNLDVDGALTVDGNTTLGNAITDTTLIAGPATLNDTLNVKGNVTLGDAITDTVAMAGPVTMDATLNVKGNTTLGDAEADTVTIVDWVLQVTSNDLLFKDDGGGTVVKICDQASTYQLDVAIGDFHVADDAVIGGDISATRGVFGGTAFSGSEELRVTGTALFDDAVTITTGGLAVTAGGIDVNGGGIGVTGSSVFEDAVTIQAELTVETIEINGDGQVFEFTGTNQTAGTAGAIVSYLKINVAGTDRKLAIYAV